MGKVLPLDGNFVGLDKLLRVDKLFPKENEEKDRDKLQILWKPTIQLSNKLTTRKDHMTLFVSSSSSPVDACKEHTPFSAFR